MSRWLSSVNNLLETLDGQVGNARDKTNDDDEVDDEQENLPDSYSGSQTVDEIINRRFGGESEDEGDNNEEDDEDEEEIDEKNEDGTPAEKIGDKDIEKHEELLVVDRNLVHENNILEESDSAVVNNESNNSMVDEERSNEAVSSDCDVDAAANHQDTTFDDGK